jgi:hypothetical protein
MKMIWEWLLEKTSPWNLAPCFLDFPKEMISFMGLAPFPIPLVGNLASLMKGKHLFLKKFGFHFNNFIFNNN